jgi:hypothetical protein
MTKVYMSFFCQVSFVKDPAGCQTTPSPKCLNAKEQPPRVNRIEPTVQIWSTSGSTESGPSRGPVL